MSVYVDRQQRRYGRMIMCHMMADTAAELHAMASAIGLRRDWYQLLSSPHYDLSLERRAEAIRRGALVLADRHELVRVIKRVRANVMADPIPWRHEASGLRP